MSGLVQILGKCRLRTQIGSDSIVRGNRGNAMRQMRFSAGSARTTSHGGSVLLSSVALALFATALPRPARALEWGPDDPYLAYGQGTYVSVVDRDGTEIYQVVPSDTTNFGLICAGTIADPDPLNPGSKDFIVKGHDSAMARFTAGLSSATQVWVNNFPTSESGKGMGDSIVWGPDGRIYRQHQWGQDATMTVNVHSASDGSKQLSDILANNPGGGYTAPAHIFVGGICFGLSSEPDLANRLYVSWHVRPATPEDWSLVVAEFVNSSPGDLSGTWSDQMYDENGNRDSGGTHHFMESSDTNSSEAYEILAMQWGYYGGQPTLYVVGKNTETGQHGGAPGWGGRYPFGADNVGVVPDNWMSVDTVGQCMGMQLGARTGVDDRTAYVLHDSGGYGLHKWDMDNTSGYPYIGPFALHGGGASGVNIIGPSSPPVGIAATADAAEPATNGSFTVTSTPPPFADITVNYEVVTTAANAATAGTDYAALSGTVTVDTSGTATITVSVLNDSLCEGTETVTVRILPGIGYQVAGAPDDEATVDIIDEDPPESFALLTPADASTIAFETQPVTFTWEAATGADTYRLEVATDAGFAGTVIDDDTLTGTSYTYAGVFDDDQTYYWRVTATNAKGGTLCDAVFSFDIPLDQTPPYVASSSPSGDDVDVDTTIVVTFSEAVNVPAPPAQWLLLTAGGTSVSGSVAAGSGNTYVFTPLQDLDEETVYTVTVTTDVEDVNGNALDGTPVDGTANDHIFTFTTQKRLTGLARGDGCVPGAGGGAALAALLAAMAAMAATARPNDRYVGVQDVRPLW